MGEGPKETRASCSHCGGGGGEERDRWREREIVWARSSRVSWSPSGNRGDKGSGCSSVVSSNFSTARPVAGGRAGGRWFGRTGVDFSRLLPPALLPPLDTMAQQSVTRVTGRRSGCHHKTFQLVIANISVAPAHARCRADSHARHAVLTRPAGTRARVPGTRTLLFPLSAGWKTTTASAAAAPRQRGKGGRTVAMVGGFFVNRYGSRFLFIARFVG